MFFTLPVGVKGVTVGRIPWVSISIAALCFAAFLATWVFPSVSIETAGRAVGRAERDWHQRPYLELRDDFRRQLLDQNAEQHYQQQHVAALRSAPDDAQRSIEQSSLDDEANKALGLVNRASLRRYSLVPSRGPAQIGWLTSLFLHWGWLHLLGNLLFFYLVGPLLEDVWGRPVFAGFYLVGGLVALVAQYALHPSSTALNLGASGAIAACMGAFALRHRASKIRMAYFFLIGLGKPSAGTFEIPAWLWAGFWFAREVFDLWTSGGTGTVAVMAHVAGFGFGALVALAMQKARVEETHLAAAIEKSDGGWIQHPLFVSGVEALQRGERDVAEQRFLEVLKTDPNNADAMLALGKLEMETQRPERGFPRIERALSQVTAKPGSNAVSTVVEELGTTLDADQLRPHLALRVAEGIMRGPEGLRILAAPFFASAGRLPGRSGAAALISAAEMSLEKGDAPAAVTRLLDRARARPELDGALRARLSIVQTNVDEAERQRRAREELPAQFHEPSVAAGPARIISCRLTKAADRGLTLTSSSGKTTEVDFGSILAVAVAIAPDPSDAAQPSRSWVWADLVVSWGDGEKGPTILRLNHAGMALDQQYPGVATKEAFGNFVRGLVAASNARVLPDASALDTGQYPRFESLGTMTAALYGAVE